MKGARTQLRRGRKIVVRLVIQTTVWVAFMAALLFAPAGTLAWPAAWVFLAEISISGMAVGLWLARHDPGLLAQRLGSPVQPGQPAWDKTFLLAVLLLWSGWLVLMALDAARYRISQVPSWVQGLGAAAILLCMYVAWLTFRANSFAAPVVRIQKERGQEVVTTGPYAYVRHPLYAGAMLFFLGAPLLLGSWYGLAAAPLLVAVIGWRVVMEERVLTAELAGYAAYAARVRYRLIPLIW